MIYMLEVWAAMSTANRQTTVLNFLNNRISGYPAGTLSDQIPVVCVAVEAAYKGWIHGVHVQVGYNDGPFRDGEWTAVIGALGSGASGPIPKSLAYRWDHDEIALTDANYQRIDY